MEHKHNCEPRAKGYCFPPHYVPLGATWICECGKIWTPTHREYGAACGCGWMRIDV